MDPIAVNFSDQANVDDGSCQYWFDDGGTVPTGGNIIIQVEIDNTTLESDSLADYDEYNSGTSGQPDYHDMEDDSWTEPDLTDTKDGGYWSQYEAPPWD